MHKWPIAAGAVIVATLAACTSGGGGTKAQAPSSAPTVTTTVVPDSPPPTHPVTHPATPSTKKATHPASKKATPDTRSTVVIQGIWHVGTDISPGVYRTDEDVAGHGCYWQKSSDSEGQNIISNDLPSGGRPQVTLKSGQWFTTQDCGTWKKIG